MANKIIGAGRLFPNVAKSVFTRVSGQAYDNMLARVKRKGYSGLPFDLDDFRMHLLRALGGNYDGWLRCRYCSGFFSVEQVVVDHAVPMSRGGGIDLDNLEFPCGPCNSRKGSMKPEEYLALLEFLDRRIPLAKVDVLKRLEISVKLAAADRWRRKKQPQSDSGEFNLRGPK